MVYFLVFLLLLLVNLCFNTCQVLQRYDVVKIDDVVKARSYRRSALLASSVVCKHLIMRPAYENLFNVATFTVYEFKSCLPKHNAAAKMLSKYDVDVLKFLVLNLRNNYHKQFM